jgi:hypothetical protein
MSDVPKFLLEKLPSSYGIFVSNQAVATYIKNYQHHVKFVKNEHGALVHLSWIYTNQSAALSESIMVQ